MGLIGSNFKYMSASHPIPCLHRSSLPSDSWRDNIFAISFPLHDHKLLEYSLLAIRYVFSYLSKITKQYVMGLPGFKKRIKDEISPQEFHIFFSNIFLSSWTYDTGRNTVFVSPSSNILSQVFPQPNMKVVV